LKACKKYGLISSDKKTKTKFKFSGKIKQKSSFCALKVLKVTEFLCVYFETLSQGWPIYDKTAENYPNYHEVSDF
jgi:hypothetical protein